MARAQSSPSPWERLCNEAFRAPWLSAEREHVLIREAQAGNATAMEELCQSHLRLVVQIAARYRRPWVQPEDLVGEGSVGLIEAIRRFDLSQTTRLSTYAAFWVRARIRAHAIENRTLVTLPSTRGARLVRGKLAHAERSLSQRLARRPTRAELAAELNVPEADVTSVVLAFSAAASLSDAGAPERCDPPDPTPGPEDVIAAQEAQALLASCLSSSLASLAERDRFIVDSHFLRDASLADVGVTLGISRQRVSQIMSRLRRSLKKELSCVAC